MVDRKFVEAADAMRALFPKAAHDCLLRECSIVDAYDTVRDLCLASRSPSHDLVEAADAMYARLEEKNDDSRYSTRELLDSYDRARARYAEGAQASGSNLVEVLRAVMDEVNPSAWDSDNGDQYKRTQEVLARAHAVLSAIDGAQPSGSASGFDVEECARSSAIIKLLQNVGCESDLHPDEREEPCDCVGCLAERDFKALISIARNAGKQPSGAPAKWRVEVVHGRARLIVDASGDSGEQSFWINDADTDDEPGHAEFHARMLRIAIGRIVGAPAPASAQVCAVPGCAYLASMGDGCHKHPFASAQGEVCECGHAKSVHHAHGGGCLGSGAGHGGWCVCGSFRPTPPSSEKTGEERK